MDDSRVLTWSALLGKWTEFAQAALALPKDGEGGLLRASVPDIIGLQAITHAMGELDTLTREGERALALDRAAVGIRAHGASLDRVWAGRALHPELRALVDDAFDALAAAKHGGLEWRVEEGPLVGEHPGALVEEIAELGFDGDLFVPAAGVPLMAGSPAVFVRGAGGARPHPDVQGVIAGFYPGLAEPEVQPVMRQVYRQMDFATGRTVRDVVVDVTDSPPGGQPLLVSAIAGGRAAPVALPPRRAEAVGELPLVFERRTLDRRD